MKGFGNLQSQDEHLFGQGDNDKLYGGPGWDILNSSDPAPEAKNAAGTSTVNWSGNVIDNVFNQGTGDDVTEGNDSANIIQSVGFDPRTGTISGGADTVLAGGGTDTINVNDGVGDDTVNCGAGGGDSVSIDVGDVLIDC